MPTQAYDRVLRSLEANDLYHTDETERDLRTAQVYFLSTVGENNIHCLGGTLMQHLETAFSSLGGRERSLFRDVSTARANIMTTVTASGQPMLSGAQPVELHMEAPRESVLKKRDRSSAFAPTHDPPAAKRPCEEEPEVPIKKVGGSLFETYTGRMRLMNQFWPPKPTRALANLEAVTDLVIHDYCLYPVVYTGGGLFHLCDHEKFTLVFTITGTLGNQQFACEQVGFRWSDEAVDAFGKCRFNWEPSDVAALCPPTPAVLRVLFERLNEVRSLPPPI